MSAPDRHPQRKPLDCNGSWPPAIHFGHGRGSVPGARPEGTPLRIVLWHGYLLGGTGSNVYTRALAREWSRAGHDVTVLSQEPQPELYDLGGARHLRPELDGPLPVFVLDRYEGHEPRLLQDLTREERERYVEQNAAAVREQLPADLVFANHVLLGGPVGAASGARFAVKAHGSELEYSMRGNAELQAWGRESLAGAGAVFVGSAHIREVVEEVVGHVDRVHEVPPGVDVGQFRPEPQGEALARLLDEAAADPPNPGNANERLPDDANAERFEAFFADDVPTVLYFGKLISNKGVHLLLEALRHLDARAVIVGFGDYRSELERLARERLAPPQTLFTGPLEHRHLVHLLPLTAATVVPSIFPEAFGMVAAEAAAAGSPPLVARHSGLEEIAEGLEADYPSEYRRLTSFATGDVTDLTAKLRELLALPPDQRAAVAAAGRRAVEQRWSWAGVAQRLLQPFN
jgi:glycosyltransferase involved in cell wall biosynthesis